MFYLPKEKGHTKRLKNCHFQISSVFIFNIWFKIFQRCYLKIIFVYLNWVELHSLLRSIISIATHFTLIYSWFNVMVSESFGLVRIQYDFLKKKEYIFIYFLILVTFDRFLFRSFYSVAPHNLFHPPSIFSMMLLENHTCISEKSWASLTTQEYYPYCYSFNIDIFLI